MVFEEGLILALEKILPDVTFIFAYRNHSEPQDPYCLVQQVSIYPTAQAERNTSHKDGTKPIETISQPVNCVFNLSFYAQAQSRIQEIGYKFQMGLQSNYFDFIFSEQNLVIQGLTKMTYTSESINTTTEIKRGTLQLVVSGIDYQSYELTDIDTVEVTSVNGVNYNLFDKEYDTKEKKWLTK